VSANGLPEHDLMKRNTRRKPDPRKL